MAEESKPQGKSKYALATEKQLEKCKCGWGCWLLDTNHKLKCCPGCVGVKTGHYRTKDIDKDGNIVSEGEQTCGCRQ